MSLAIKELDSSQRAELVELFLEIFTGAPWYDVWEDPDRPALYLEELTGSPNSLSLGLYDGSRLLSERSTVSMNSASGQTDRVKERVVNSSVRSRTSLTPEKSISSF